MTMGVGVRDAVGVTVGVFTAPSVQISPKGMAGGGDAWVTEPRPQTQPSTAPSLSSYIPAPMAE